jgi:hypothetical protein
MGNFHDAYLFEPESFINTVIPYINALKEDKSGYSFVRAAAIDLYDNDPQVRFLAEEYGGWNRDAIVAQIPSDYPYEPDDIAFWFVVLLYSFCRMKESCTLGLGNHWHLFDCTLEALGWNDADRHLLIIGNDFTHLVEKALSKGKGRLDELNVMGYWDYVKPFSQGGQVGWIGLQDSQRLLNKIIDDEHRLTSVVGVMKADFKLLQEAYQAAFEMLVAARDAHNGLCMIISG